MRYRYLALMGALAAVAAVSLALVLIGAHTSQVAEAADVTSLRTSWGEPDLQGIWNDRYQTPLQRPKKYAGRELLTEEEVAALDGQRAAIPQRPRVRRGKGSEADVAGAHQRVFVLVRADGRRTTLIVEPPVVR